MLQKPKIFILYYIFFEIKNRKLLDFLLKNLKLYWQNHIYLIILRGELHEILRNQTQNRGNQC